MKNTNRVTLFQLNILRLQFQNADDAWGAELRRLFGNGAGDVRYNHFGKGADGSTLRILHDARMAAMAAYESARG